MKKIFLLLLLILSIGARAQEKDALYVFDASWKPTTLESAHYIVHTRQVNDTCWQWDFYNFIGPLLQTKQFGDKEGKQPNGVFYHYNAEGYVDSATHFQGGKQNGDAWKRTGDSLKHQIKYVYRDDSLIEAVDMDKIKKDSGISFPDEKESDYPGGIAGWQRYLLKHLEYPDRAMNSNIQGQVVVVFIVDKSGNVIDPYISKSVEYSLDEETLKIIKHSGKWEPAFQNGHNVKSYKSQPLNFKLQ